MKNLLLLIIIFSITGLKAEKKNVLLIIVDDLRADLQEFSKKEIHKPAMDSLSAGGVTFKRAYCQKALCVPSRQSFLTGLRPNKFGAGFNDHFRRRLPKHVTLPQYFKQNAYKSYSIGKVFHHRDRKSWTEPSWVPKPDYYFPIYGTKEGIKIQKSAVRKNMFFPKDKNWWAVGGKWAPGLIWENPDVKDNVLTDGKLADYAIEKIKNQKGAPFFMAVGFFRPHLPFIAPKKYFDLYPLNSIKLPENESLPNGAPTVAAQTGGEWRKYYEIAQKGMPEKRTRKEYIRAYLASVSYVDSQIGRLLKCLEEQRLKEKTIVVLMSDHGYHLFDNSSFGKCTNFEDAVKVVFTVKTPFRSKKRSTNAIIELVDLYPSICELAGLEIPGNLDGVSFVNVLKSDGKGKDVAYSQYERNGYKGLSVRNDRFRYTLWKKGKKTIEELYDFDSEIPETKNVISSKMFEEQVNHLKEKLMKGFP